MNKIKAWVEGVRGFFGEVQTELKRCAWPTRSELVGSTVVVVVSVMLLSVVVGLSDGVMMVFLKLVLR
jgi:preprotein translocase subunit SecE